MNWRSCRTKLGSQGKGAGDEPWNTKVLIVIMGRARAGGQDAEPHVHGHGGVVGRSERGPPDVSCSVFRVGEVARLALVWRSAPELESHGKGHAHAPATDATSWTRSSELRNLSP